MKWKMNVWTFSRTNAFALLYLLGLDFINGLIACMERASDPSLALFRRACKTKSRDLNQCLEEERRSLKLKPARMTPLYATGTGTNNTATTAATAATLGLVTAFGKITTAVKPSPSQKFFAKYQAFTSPYILIEEANYIYAPFHKQYEPKEAKVTFPLIRWESTVPQCPFSYGHRIRTDGKYWSELETDPIELADALAEMSNQAQKVEARKLSQDLALHNHKRHRPVTTTKRASLGGDPAKRQAFSPKAKPGFCECCYEKYENLHAHIETEKHRTYSKEATNYASVDKILARIVRPSVFDYNPIVVYGARKAVHAQVAAHMSPAQSTVHSICTKKSGSSALRTSHCPLPITIEDKENDSPSGLDLTGLDKGYLAEKRLTVDSSDVFETGERPRQKARRIAASKLKL